MTLHQRQLLGYALCGAILFGGCGSSVTLQAPSDFVVLEEDGDAPYEVRATSAHGVVVAARSVPNEPKGNLSFWVDAVKNRMRTLGGYALLDETEVTAGSGQAGRHLKFGRDEGSQTYLYWLAMFVTEADVILVEAGGLKDEFERAEGPVAGALRSVRFE